MNGILKGIPASSGAITGKARIILSEGDFSKFSPGEILVTRQTSPAWTPLLAVAGAAVTEIGGQLSHAAIIAREYGIPAVVGVKEATKLIKSGWTITVKGEEGEIELFPHTPGV